MKIICLFIGLFLVTEIGFYIAGFRGFYVKESPVEYSELYGWGFKKNFKTELRQNLRGFNFETNSWGFRDKEYGEEKQDGKYRIVVIGDYLVEGYGIHRDEMWDHLLEQEYGGEVEIILLGVQNYDLLQQFRVFREVALKLNPDHVIQLASLQAYDPLRREHSIGAILYARPDFYINDGALNFGKPVHHGKDNVTQSKFIKTVKGVVYRSYLLSWLKQQNQPFIEGKLKPLLYYLGLRKKYAREGIDAEIENQNQQLKLKYQQAVDIAYKEWILNSETNGFNSSIIYVKEFNQDKMPDIWERIVQEKSIPLHQLLMRKEEKHDYINPNKLGHLKLAQYIKNNIIHK